MYGGWVAYGKYQFQRCWAHIIREAYDLAKRNPDCNGAQDIIDRLRSIFDSAKKASNHDYPVSYQEKESKRLLSYVEEIVAKYVSISLFEAQSQLGMRRIM